MIKKSLCVILAAVLSVSSLTACGQNKSENDSSNTTADISKLDNLLDKDSPVTINVWHYYNGVQQTEFNKMVSDFNNSVGLEKGIIVNATTKTTVDDLSKNVVASVNGDPGADSPPDIFCTYAETAYTIDKLGKLADLKKYFSDDELDDYVDNYIKEGDILNKGELKIFPTAKSTEVMILNKTDWDKFAKAENVSYDDLKTWESLTKVAEKYYDYTDALTPDVKDDGKAFFGRDSIANYIVVGAKQLDSPVVSVDENGKGKFNLSKDAAKKLWDNYYVPYVKGYYKAESRFRSDDAKIGSIIDLIGSTTSAIYYPTEVTIDDDYTYSIDNVVLPIPNFEDADPYVVQQGAGMSVIKSDEKKEYACSVFLKWFTDSERNIKFSIESGYLPVKKEGNNFEKIQEIAKKNNINMNKTLVDSIKIGIDEINNSTPYTCPPFDNSTTFRDTIGSYMTDTSSDDRKTVEEKIANGENRDAVIKEFTNEKAFDKWYDQMSQKLESVLSEK